MTRLAAARRATRGRRNDRGYGYSRPADIPNTTPVPEGVELIPLTGRNQRGRAAAA